jgi:mono/diheme cytochrome c family protein/plastocyanin
MTDTPGREPEGEEPVARDPEPEERLPVPRPPADAAPVERFTSPPPIRAVELTPERAAQVVRQSSNARWVGFLAVIVVILFIAIYWFYEVGLPAGLSQPRVGENGTELEAQQVTAVERGYNVYEANCARCHGENGEGGIGPVLNRQDKLFAHLNAQYLEEILTVGGRFACGNPESLMPVWADSNGGPLNYRQIEEVIAFIRAPSTNTYIVRDPELLDPVIDPATGEPETFNGWVDESYEPAPGATPYPACWQDEFAAPSAAPSGEPTTAPSGEPSGDVIDIAALNIQFDTDTLIVPAETVFTLAFDNQDAGIPHNVEIRDEANAAVFVGEIFNGVDQRDYQVGPIPAGTYTFLCTVHPNMTGTLRAE